MKRLLKSVLDVGLFCCFCIEGFRVVKCFEGVGFIIRIKIMIVVRFYVVGVKFLN